MAAKRVLLGTTALLALGGISAASAAEVKPLGSLDINVGGFLRSYAFIGDLKEKTGSKAGSYDFRNDTEVYIYARGTDEATGLQYGGNIELEADTNSTGNADETFVFVKGTFGEVRLGDDDGAADNQRVGAGTIAAFSGGIDGVGPFDLGSVVFAPNSSDTTKVIYYTPTFAGLNFGISFTPHADSDGNDIGTTDSGTVDDLTEAGLAYKGDFGGFGVIGSVVGSYGHFNTNDPILDNGGDQYWEVQGGLVLSLYGFKLAGAVGTVQGGIPAAGGGAAFQRGSDYQYYNVGGAYALGPANLSVTWGQVWESNSDDALADDPKPKELAFGVDVGVAPGLVVGGEVAYFDLDNGDATGFDDNGYLGLVGLRLAF